jgi:hypothetical protein
MKWPPRRRYVKSSFFRNRSVVPLGFHAENGGAEDLLPIEIRQRFLADDLF